MERLRIADAMFLADGTAASENEFLDVVAVGAYVIIAEERKFLAALGQLCPQSRTMIACWPFGPVGAVGTDDLLDHAAHVHDPVDLRPPRVVILLLNGVGLESSGKLFRVIMGTAGHPASGLHTTRDLGMIGILLVMGPGVPAGDRIDFEQADQEDEPALQLVLRNVRHAVIGIVQSK